MLLCDEHHRLIDKADLPGHPEERLRVMKESHEQRIELLTGLGPEKRSHVVLYGANIGTHNAPVSMTRAAQAMLPDWYPAEPRGIEIGLTNSVQQDHDATYWAVERDQLRQMILQQVKPRLARGEVHHFSVFALAPQPLLMLLGYLLSDIPAAEVYQLHREPEGWRWQADPAGFDYCLTEPHDISGPPALVFSLSATITDQRIRAALPDASIWKISCPHPNNDFLRGRGQARLFRQQVRILLDRIKAIHGEKAMLHVFPAMPVALAVDFGRVVMPKADLHMIVYDQNRHVGGFAPSLTLP